MMTEVEQKRLDKNIKLWTDVLKEDEHWDFNFLEKIILRKVKLMRDFYRTEESYISQDSIDQMIQEMTVVIEALERLIAGDYIHFPEGMEPLMGFVTIENKEYSTLEFTYHPDFGEDKVREAYQRAEDEEKRDRELVYNTLRDKSTGWWS